ncbi:Inorganic pyrophosphatase [Serratia symbiotica]|nr:Inorganic pyrophosphatase [Serratia symbiotica]
MSFNLIPSGKNVPEDIYVIIEISANSVPVKYEIDKNTNTLFVDRFLPTSMSYPCNYGYINNTISLDGDPIDVLVPTIYPLQSGSVIRSRPIGALKMIDESGEDIKIIAVPHYKLTKEYNDIKNINDLPESLCIKIVHFFQHYKDLEIKKWVKIEGWIDSEEAKSEILSSVKRKNK